MPQTKLYRPKDTKVTIYNNNGSILLRFTYKQKSYNYSLGLPVSEKNLKIAIQKCHQITNDIIFNTFDTAKYEIKDKVEKKDEGDFSLITILDFYQTYHPNLDSSTLESLNILKKWLSKTTPENALLSNLDKFLLFLKTEIKHDNSDKRGYKDTFIAVHFKILKSAIYLNFKLGKISTKSNIQNLMSSLKTQKQKEIKIYSKEEIKLIIQESYSFFSYFIYGAFIEFRFLTGARPSEVTPLLWTDIIQQDTKTFITFNTRFTDGLLKKGLKKGTDYRLFPCNDQLKSLLNKIPRINALIFPSPTGLKIDTNNFSKRQWKKLINSLIKDRKLNYYIPFYDQRHCFGTHICRETKDLKTVSYIMGNSPTTLQKNYLSIDFNFEIPEI